jgi:hypothetical protein
LTISQEDRAVGAASEKSWEQERRARLPEHPVSCSAFTADASAFVGQIEVVHVEWQDLIGSRRGLVQQRHRVRSRSDTSSRRHNAASWSRVNALVRSTRMFGRSNATVGSVLNQARRRQKAQADRRIASWRTRVAGAVLS